MHELMRHASPRTTLEFYVKARKTLKLKAQKGIQKMLFPGDADSASSIEGSDVSGDVRQQQKRNALNHIASMIYGSEPSDVPSEPDDAQIDDDSQDHLM